MSKKLPFKSSSNYLFWGSFFYTDLAERLFAYFKKRSFVSCREITFDVFSMEAARTFHFIPLKYSADDIENWILFHIKDHYLAGLKNIFGDDLKTLGNIFLEMASSRKLPGNAYSFILDDWDNVDKEKIEGQLNMVVFCKCDVKDILDCEIKIAFPYGYARKRITSSFPSIPPALLAEKKAEDTMSEISSRFIASKDKPWNVLDYMRRLRDQEMQHFLYQLMSYGLRDKELSLLLVPLDDSTRKKVIVNLSKNIQEEVIYNIPQMSFAKLTSKENKVLHEQYKKTFAKADTIILDLLEKGKLEFESLVAFTLMKDNFEMHKLMDILQKSDLQKMIRKNYEPLTLQKALSALKARDLVLSLIDADQGTLKTVDQNLSNDARQRLMEDMVYYKKNADQKDIFRAKVKLIKSIKRFCSVNIFEQSKELVETFLHYDSAGRIRKLLFEEIPMEFFARAFHDCDEVFFEKLAGKLTDSRKRVFFSMLEQVRKTGNAEDNKKTSAEYIIKKVRVLVEKGKIVFFSEDPSKREKFRELLEL
jgi:hypothetical protein